jgi:Cu+-exporting ATPase
MNKVLKDPVCGMIVLPEKGFTVHYCGYTVYFCTEYCQKKFRERLDRYLAAFLASGTGNGRRL